MSNQKSNIEVFNDCCKYNDLGCSLEFSFSEVKPIVGVEMRQLRYLYAFSCIKEQGAIHFDHTFFEIYGVGSVTKELLAEQGLRYKSSTADRSHDYSYRTINPAYLLLDEGSGELKWVVYNSCSKFRECMLALKEADDMSKLATNYVKFWTPTFYEKENERSLDTFMAHLFFIHDLKVAEFGEYNQLFEFFEPYITRHTWNNFMCQY